MKLRKTALAALAAAAIAASAAASAEDRIVICSNADEEAQEAMKHALDGNGFAGRYVLQAMGTSELGGKLMAEKRNIEADIITLSTYYLDSAQARDHVFADLSFDHKAADGSEVPFYAPILGNTGALFVNTKVLKDSGPLKKIRAGEVAVGFGLRHQAVADKKKGLPVDVIDPKEGNFTLTEAIAVVDKGEKTNPDAMKAAEVIVKKARPELLKFYPFAIYQGETVDADLVPAYPRAFKEKLTVELLKKHQEMVKDE